MHIKHIHEIIETLAECAKMELCKGIENVDTKEMGEVAEMLKELCEAEYYAKITKAMDEHEYGEDYDENGPMDKRYYRGQPRDSRGRYMSRRGRRGYEEPMYYTMTPEMYREHGPEYWRDMDRQDGRMYYAGGGDSGNSSIGMSGGMSTSSTGGSRNYGGENGRDYREGRSGHARRGYMETKEAHPGNSPEDKQRKTKELEKYMNELSSDVTEMISGASNEEKTMLKTKMQALLAKI